MKQTEAATGGVLWKKVFLEISQSSQESTCARDSFLIKLHAWNFIKKESLARVYSSEFYKISKNAFFAEHLRTTASEKIIIVLFWIIIHSYLLLATLFTTNIS